MKISGFYDEVSFRLKDQIAMVKKLGCRYMCPRVLDGRNIADIGYTYFAGRVKPRLDEADIRFSIMLPRAVTQNRVG